MAGVALRACVSPVLAATAFVVIACAALSAQTAVPGQELRNVFPVEARVRDFALTADGRRTYYTTTCGDLWLYDRDRARNTRILSGTLWDLSLSPRRDAIAYTKAGETRREQYVWAPPLDSVTGLAAGRERRLSSNAGDVPSISPDGQRVAFARDDTTGVGRSVVVVPIGGPPGPTHVNAMESIVSHAPAYTPHPRPSTNPSTTSHTSRATSRSAVRLGEPPGLASTDRNLSSNASSTASFRSNVRTDS